MNESIILRYFAVVAPPKPPPTTAIFLVDFQGATPVAQPAINQKLPIPTIRPNFLRVSFVMFYSSYLLAG